MGTVGTVPGDRGDRFAVPRRPVSCRLLWTRTARCAGLTAQVKGNIGRVGRPATDTCCVTLGPPYPRRTVRRG
jgi:hypothetical protein